MTHMPSPRPSPTPGGRGSAPAALWTGSVACCRLSSEIVAARGAAAAPDADAATDEAGRGEQQPEDRGIENRVDHEAGPDDSKRQRSRMPLSAIGHRQQ